MNRPQCFSKSVAKAHSQKTRANKWGVSDDEFSRGPIWPSCVRIGFLPIDDPRDRIAVPRQQSVLDLNVLDRTQDGLFRRRTLGAEMPLQIADPQYEFGDRCCARI